ncbi:MAG: hypothetical protein ACRESK_00815, partial [Gammaproteobacteria bacterium]
MRILTRCICTLFLLSGFAGIVAAKDEKAQGGSETAVEKRHSGVETSAEHKSEEGLEHGKAYAGSKEKKVKEKGAKADEESGDDEESEDDEGSAEDNGDDDKGKDKTKSEKSDKGK